MWQLRQLLPPAPTRCAPGRDTPCAVAAGQGHRIVKTARSHWQASLRFSFSFSVEVKVKSAYGQGGLPSKGIWARARTHFRM